MALIEINGFKDSDINNFARCFGLRVPAINAFGVGVKKALPPGVEATLDLEVLDAASPGLKSIDVYESPASAADSLRALTAPLQNPGFKPQVISASLGLCEPFVFADIGKAGTLATESALQEAAASGITILAASGDAGSAACTDQGVPLDRLAISYPASSWWVTAVGGTNIVLTPSNTIAGQIVWNDTSAQPGSAGGGGVSELWVRPPYQNGTVAMNSRGDPGRLDARRRGARVRDLLLDLGAGLPFVAPRGRRSAARAPRRRCSPAPLRTSTRTCGFTADRTSGSSTRCCTRSVAPRRSPLRCSMT